MRANGHCFDPVSAHACLARRQTAAVLVNLLADVLANSLLVAARLLVALDPALEGLLGAVCRGTKGEWGVVVTTNAI